jgi:hypothetical protein
MNLQQKVIKNKVGLLKLAETLGSEAVIELLPLPEKSASPVPTCKSRSVDPLLPRQKYSNAVSPATPIRRLIL